MANTVLSQSSAGIHIYEVRRPHKRPSSSGSDRQLVLPSARPAVGSSGRRFVRPSVRFTGRRCTVSRNNTLAKLQPPSRSILPFRRRTTIRPSHREVPIDAILCSHHPSISPHLFPNFLISLTALFSFSPPYLKFSPSLLSLSSSLSYLLYALSPISSLL